MGDVDFHWQVQQVKQRLSEVLRAAESDGPQFVTRHGKDVAVVISIEDYHQLKADEEPRSLLDVLTAGPTVKLTDEEFDIVFGQQRVIDPQRESPFVGPSWE